MPKICFIADSHCQHRKLTIPKCDLLIHCGDICTFQREDEQVLQDIDEWFAEIPAAQVIVVGGNHDFMLQQQQFAFRHATLLQDSLIEVQGLSIYGSPWCPELRGFAYYASDEELIERWRAIPRDIDVLVTHTPPYGYLDLPSSGQAHLGCRHLRAELARIRPRVHAFGHVHASYGSCVHDDVQFINAAVVGGRTLEVRNGPTMLNLDASRPS